MRILIGTLCLLIAMSCKSTERGKSAVAGLESGAEKCELINNGDQSVRTTYAPANRSQCLADQRAVNILEGESIVTCSCDVAEGSEACILVNLENNAVNTNYAPGNQQQCLVDKSATNMLDGNVDCMCGAEIPDCLLLEIPANTIKKIYSAGNTKDCVADQNAINMLKEVNQPKVDCRCTPPAVIGRCQLMNTTLGTVYKEYIPANRTACLTDQKAMKMLSDDGSAYSCECK
jgi:hypothetical protein